MSFDLRLTMRLTIAFGVSSLLAVSASASTVSGTYAEQAAPTNTPLIAASAPDSAPGTSVSLDALSGQNVPMFDYTNHIAPVAVAVLSDLLIGEPGTYPQALGAALTVAANVRSLQIDLQALCAGYGDTLVAVVNTIAPARDGWLASPSEDFLTASLLPESRVKQWPTVAGSRFAIGDAVASSRVERK